MHIVGEVGKREEADQIRQSVLHWLQAKHCQAQRDSHQHPGSVHQTEPVLQGLQTVEVLKRNLLLRLHTLNGSCCRRRDDDIAIVNAAFNMEVVDSRVKEVSMAFGGMAPTTVMPGNTIKALVGQQFGNGK